MVTRYREGTVQLCPWEAGLGEGGTYRNGVVGCVGADPMGQELGRRHRCLQKGEWSPERGYKRGK